MDRKVSVELRAITRQYRTQIKGAGRDTAMFGTKLEGLAGKGTKAFKMMGTAALAGGAAIAAVAAGSIAAFAGFDAKMTESLAIMGDVSAGMRQEMSDAAREIGTTTKFSAEEAAESYFFLASAGLDAAQSIKALPLVAKFALYSSRYLLGVGEDRFRRKLRHQRAPEAGRLSQSMLDRRKSWQRKATGLSFERR